MGGGWLTLGSIRQVHINNYDRMPRGTFCTISVQRRGKQITESPLWKLKI
jgi:hypothetical protein